LFDSPLLLLALFRYVRLWQCRSYQGNRVGTCVCRWKQSSGIFCYCQSLYLSTNWRDGLR